MEELIRNLYLKYAPDKDIEEQLRYIQQKYGNDVTTFVSDFYAKYAPGKLNQDTVNHINKNYFFKPEEDVDFQEQKNEEDDTIVDNVVDWFNQTWFGSGFMGARVTGEANNLMAEDFSNVSSEAIQEFIEAKQDQAENYVASKTMQEFQEQYVAEGQTWTAWWRGVKKSPELLPELLVQSFGTQLGTLYYSPKASLAGMGTGALAGSRLGKIGAVAGALGGLATSMEAALTFGDLIDAELQKEGKEFTDDNIRDLL